MRKFYPLRNRNITLMFGDYLGKLNWAARIHEDFPFYEVGMTYLDGAVIGGMNVWVVEIKDNKFIPLFYGLESENEKKKRLSGKGTEKEKTIWKARELYSKMQVDEIMSKI